MVTLGKSSLDPDHIEYFEKLLAWTQTKKIAYRA